MQLHLVYGNDDFTSKLVVLWTYWLENSLWIWETKEITLSETHTKLMWHFLTFSLNLATTNTTTTTIPVYTRTHWCVFLILTVKAGLFPYKVNELTVQNEQGERYKKSCLTVWVPDSFECPVVWLTKTSQHSLSQSENCNFSHETTTHHMLWGATPAFCSSSYKYAWEI